MHEENNARSVAGTFQQHSGFDGGWGRVESSYDTCILTRSSFRNRRVNNSSVNKQLLDEVEHDIMNYQPRSVLSAEAKG